MERSQDAISKPEKQLKLRSKSPLALPPLTEAVFRFSLPVAPKSGVKFVGSGWALRSGSAFYPFPVSNIDIFGVAQPFLQIINTGGGLTHASASWGNGDMFALEIEYEID
jgi:hypothetical protein